MKLRALSLLLILGQTVHADEIKCVFTEPFFDLEINTTAKTLKRTEIGADGEIETTVISKAVSVKKLPSKTVSSVVEVPRYQILADGKEALILELDNQGSDGMSEYVYPYSTKYGKNNYGGCYSDVVKRTNAVYEDEQ